MSLIDEADVHNYAYEGVSYTGTQEENPGNDFAPTKSAQILFLTAANSLVNNVKEIANWAGADLNVQSNYQLMEEYDADLTKYYAEHPDAYGLGGEILSSFIPMTAGLKVLKLAKTGRFLPSATKYLGKFDEMRKTNLKLAREAIQAEGSAAQIKKFKRAALVGAIGDQALEGMAMEVAAYSATHLGTLLNDDTKTSFEKITTFGSHIAGWGAIGGGAIGGTLLHLGGKASLTKEFKKVFREVEAPNRIQALPENRAAEGTAASWYIQQAKSLEDKLKVLDTEDITQTGKAAATLELEKRLVKENAVRYKELAHAHVNKLLSSVEDKALVENVKKLLPLDKELTDETVGVYRNALTSANKLGRVSEQDAEALVDLDKLLQTGKVTAFETDEDMLRVLGKDTYDKVKQGATRQYAIRTLNTQTGKESEIFLFPEFFASGRNKETLEEALAHRKLIQDSTNVKDPVMRYEIFGIKDPELEHLIKIHGVDSTPVYSRVYSLYKSGDKNFVLKHPVLTKFFSQNDFRISKLYGKEEELFLNVKTGGLQEKLQTIHLGDLGKVEVQGSKKLTQIKVRNKIYQKDAGAIFGKKGIDAEAQYAIEQANIDKLYGKKLKGKPLLQIEDNDLPKLEAVITGKIKHGAETVKGIKYKGKEYYELADMLEVLKQEKIETMKALGKKFPGISTEELAQRINTSEDFVAPTTKESQDVAEFLRMPQQDFNEATYVKVGYNVEDIMTEDRVISQTMLNDEVENQIYEASVRADQILGGFAKLLPDIQDATIATNTGAGATLLTNASARGEYNTMSQIASYVGHQVQKITENWNKEFADDLLVANRKLLQGEDKTKAQFIAMKNWYEHQGERVYLYSDGADTVLTTKSGIARIDDKDDPLLVKTFVTDFKDEFPLFHFTDDSVLEWANQWNKTLANKFNYKKATLAEAQGVNRQIDDAFYMPPAETEFFTYVKTPEKDLFGTGDIGIIRATTAEDLQQKIQMAKAHSEANGYEWNILTPEDVKSRKVAQNEYEYSKGITTSFVDSELRKLGKGADVIPNPDINQSLQDILNWGQRQNATIARSAIETKYSKFFSEITEMERQVQKVSEASSGGKYKFFARKGLTNPFAEIKRTMLNITDNSEPTALDSLNNFIDTYGGKVQQIFDKRNVYNRLKETDFEEFNKELERAGVPGSQIYKNTAEFMLAASPKIDKKAATKFAGRLNGLLAMTTLRIDYIDPIINKLSFAIAAGPELSHIKKLASDPEWMKDAYVTLEQAEKIKEFSVPKLIAGSMKRYFNKDIKSTRLSKYKQYGLVDDAVVMYRQTLEDAVLTGKETIGDLAAKESKVKAGVGKLAQRLSKYSDWTNEYLQYLAVDIIWDLGEKAGLAEKQIANMALTFKNRVLATHIPSQKPKLFRGAIGTPVSLFQNYQFNMINNLMRYAENGEKTTLAKLGALQSTIFGASSLPGFTFLNQTIIGNNTGPDHTDLHSLAYASLGTEVGEAALFGAPSKILGASFFTRGNLNPHNTLLIPTQFDEVPVLRAGMSIFGEMYKGIKQAAGGGDIGQTAMDTIAKIGISRPLTGIVDSIRGYTTDRQDRLVTSSATSPELFNWANTVRRIAGSRPFDEAVQLQSIYRTAMYNAKNKKELGDLNAIMRTHMLGKDEQMDPKLFELFARKYVANGGKLDRFHQVYMNNLERATIPSFDRAVDRYKNSDIVQHLEFLQE